MVTGRIYVTQKYLLTNKPYENPLDCGEILVELWQLLKSMLKRYLSDHF